MSEPSNLYAPKPVFCVELEPKKGNSEAPSYKELYVVANTFGEAEFRAVRRHGNAGNP
jgi:hypothetical protein